MRSTENLKNLPHGFDESADLQSKRQNHKEDFFKICVLLKNSKLQNPERDFTYQVDKLSNLKLSLDVFLIFTHQGKTINTTVISTLILRKITG